MTAVDRIKIAALTFLLALLSTVGAGWIGYVSAEPITNDMSIVLPDEAVQRSVLDHAIVYRDGTPRLMLVSLPAFAAAPTTAPATEPSVLDDLAKLRAAYEALRASTDKSAKMLLWAGLLAAGLKLLLDLINLAAKRKPQKWLAWVALGLAVPIALLSHYALGHSVFDSLVYAGAGPGAIVVNEIIKRLSK
jgi:hypothetical protein